MHLKSYAIDGRLLRSGRELVSDESQRQDNDLGKLHVHPRHHVGAQIEQHDVRYEASPEAVERFERNLKEMWGREGTGTP